MFDRIARIFRRQAPPVEPQGSRLRQPIPEEVTPSAPKEPKPKQFNMAKRDSLGERPAAKSIAGWMTNPMDHASNDEAFNRHLEICLEHDDFVERCFKNIVAQRGADPKTYESMMGIPQRTKTDMVRQNLKKNHARDIPSPELREFQEDKENRMVQRYNEAGRFVPSKDSPKFTQPLKRKRSSISLRRVKSIGELKRQKVRNAFRKSKKAAVEDDTTSTHYSSFALSETNINIRPRSAGQSIKSFFTGSHHNHISDTHSVASLEVIAKADDEGEHEEAPARERSESTVAHRSFFQIDDEPVIEPRVFLDATNPAPLDVETHVLATPYGRNPNEETDSDEDDPNIPDVGPSWNPKTDAINNEYRWPKQQEAQRAIFVKNLRDMRNYFDPSFEPKPKELGDLDFEDILRQMLMFVRCEEHFLVLGFADTAMECLMAIITLLASKEFRPMHESKTLRALISVMLALVQRHWGTGKTFVEYESDNGSKSAKLLFYENTKEFDDMFQALVEMKFSHGEARRGFSNFRDRRLVIELMSAWVKGPDVPQSTREFRAKRVLEFFKDPEDKDQHDFIQAMHQPRPYTRWYTELDRSTSGFGGVGWIWHNKGNKLKDRDFSRSTHFDSYYEEFKPIEDLRPDATCSTVRSHTETLVTCYVAATIDLMTILVASLPTRRERLDVRAQFEASRFKEIFESRFVRASQKNFPVVHKALQAYTDADHADRIANVMDPACQYIPAGSP